jgi:hypothetical protein
MDVKLSYINTHDQLADIFTKPLGFIQHNLLKNRMTGYDVWLFVRVGVLKLAASPSTGNGASPLSDGRPPLYLGDARGEAKGLTPVKRKGKTE